MNEIFSGALYWLRQTKSYFNRTPNQLSSMSNDHALDLVQSNHFLNECEFQPYPQTLEELLFFKLYVEAIQNKRKE